MMAHPLSSRATHFSAQQAAPSQALAGRNTAGFAPIMMRAVNDEMEPAAGPCVTCHWATGDGRRFECHRLSAELHTLGAGCAHWEREPGVEG